MSSLEPALGHAQPSTPRVAAPTPGEGEGLARRVHSWMRPDGLYPARQELPFLLGEDERTTTRVAYLGERLVAHAALHERPLRIAGGCIPIGIIGAVATDPDYRGRGCAALVLDELIAEAEHRELELLLLWDEHGGSLYERAGFTEAGIEFIFPIRRSDLRPLGPTWKVRRIKSPLELGAVRALYAQEPGGLSRTARDWHRLAGLPGTDMYGLFDRGTGTLVSYGVVGKGSDLGSCLHEWCGPLEALPPLLAGVTRSRPEESLFVMSPPWRRDLVELPSLDGIPMERGALGMVRAARPGRFLRCAAPGLTPETAATPHGAKAMRHLFGHRDHEAHPLCGRGLYVFGLDSM